MKTRVRVPSLLIIGPALGLILLVVLVLLIKPREKDPHEGQVYVDTGLEYEWITPLEGVEVNPLTPDDFTQYNGSPVYSGEDFIVRRGVDVSEHQHEIDWGLAARELDFAFIRLGYRGYTEGGVYLDPYFEANYSGAREKGLDVGVYFYSQAISVQEAIEEANFVLEKLDGRELDLPVIFDWEKVHEEGARTLGLSAQTRTDCAVAFCQTLRMAGYDSGLYFNLYLGYHDFDLSRLTDYMFWVAVYHDSPDFYYAFPIWQYTDSATVPGILGPADMNLQFIPATPEDSDI